MNMAPFFESNSRPSGFLFLTSSSASLRAHLGCSSLGPSTARLTFCPHVCRASDSNRRLLTSSGGLLFVLIPSARCHVFPFHVPNCFFHIVRITLWHESNSCGLLVCMLGLPFSHFRTIASLSTTLCTLSLQKRFEIFGEGALGRVPPGICGAQTTSARSKEASRQGTRRGISNMNRKATSCR